MVHAMSTPHTLASKVRQNYAASLWRKLAAFKRLEPAVHFELPELSTAQ
jgi:hypothetical protein